MKKKKKNLPQVKNEVKDKNDQSNQVVRSKEKTNKIWDFFCSVKLAVIIILVMAVACVLGTFILQGRTMDEYTARYGYGLAKFFQITQFNNLFYSHWFSILLLLLCANLICCTIRRWRNTFLQTGFVLTHLSLILILGGGVIKFQLGVKGGVNVYEGKSVDYFLTQEIDPSGKFDYKKKDLPFKIALDDFILEKNEPKFQLVTYVKSKDKQKIFAPKAGKSFRFPGTDYRVKIQKYFPDAELVQEPLNASDKPDNPAIFTRLFGSDRALAEGWLLAKDTNFYDDRKQNLRVEYVWLSTQQEFDKAIHTVDTTNATLTVAVSGKGILRDFPLELNKTFKIEGTDYSVTILQYVLNYGDKRPVSEQPVNNPAIQVEINGPEGSETRWIFENFPDWDQMHPSKFKNLKLSCSGVGTAYKTENIIRICHAPDGNQMLVFIRGKKIVESIPWEFDQKYTFSDVGRDIMITGFYPSFEFRREVVKRSDQIGTPAIFVEVEGPSGKVSDWLFSNSQYATWYTDNNFALLYESTGESVKHFISNLRIVKDGETVVKKSIKVNDPLEYEGYVIYQSSYDPEAGKYTGLQIVKDPGIPVVYSGFGALCFGVIFIFYVKPFLRKKKKKEIEVE